MNPQTAYDLGYDDAVTGLTTADLIAKEMGITPTAVRERARTRSIKGQQLSPRLTVYTHEEAAQIRLDLPRGRHRKA